MTLPYERQATLATVQQDFLTRITAGSFNSAVNAYGATPNADATKQAQRMALVNALVIDPAFSQATFAWWVVSRPSINAVEDITDAFIASTLNTATFDNIAAQLFVDVTAP